MISRFLDEDLRERRTQAEETSAFMASQITDLEASMADQEKKIADFRAKHPNNRPEALLFNQQSAQNLLISLQSLETQIASLDRNRGDIRAQLAGVDPYSRVISDGQVLTTPAIQLKALQGKYSTLTAQYGPDHHPDVVRIRHQIESLQAIVGQTQDTAELTSQLKDARTNLAAAEKQYGPNHPDVEALRRQVTGLETQLATASSNPTHHDLIKPDADNPAYLMLEAQLNSIESQYSALSTQRDTLKRQYDAQMAAVAETPAVEQEFAALSRDYDNAQLRYRELKEKR